MRRDSNNKIICSAVIPAKGRINDAFINKNKIVIDSTPKDQVSDFLNNTFVIESSKVCFEQWRK